jgi:hypothetical protein
MTIDTNTHSTGLDSGVALCNMHLFFWTLVFAIFVFCLILFGLEVETWGGVEGECMHSLIANGQSF